MAKGLVSDTNLTAIANAIRSKNGSTDEYTPAQMATAISDIPTSQVDQTTALQWMLNNKTSYAGIAAGLTTLTTLPAFTQPSGITNYNMMLYGTGVNSSGLSGLDFPSSGNVAASSMFERCSSLNTLPSFDYSRLYNAEKMFSRSSLSTVDLGVCPNLQYTNGMFSYCTNLTSVTIKPYYRCTTTGMFEGCSNLTTVVMERGTNGTGYLSLVGNSGITPGPMFKGCSKLTSVPNIRGSSGGSSGEKSNMFNSTYEGCTSLTTIPSSALSGVINVSLNRVCYNCTSLTEISGSIQAASVSDMTSAFYRCGLLTSISFAANSGIACNSFAQAFYGCTSLTSAPALVTSSGRNFANMFCGCTSLTDVPVYDLSADYNWSGRFTNMFANCPSLSNQSLNNIMASLLTIVTGVTKTLKYIGLSSTQATTCTGLSNWAALSAAGWTTGY